MSALAPERVPPRAHGWPRLSVGWWLLAILLVGYGSLLPFELRQITLEEAQESFRSIPYLELGLESRADLIANLLVYVPLGFLFMAAWPGRRGPLALLLAVLVNGALAIGLEFVQQFFEPRTVSLNDIILEVLGSLLGGIGFLIWGRRFQQLRLDAGRLGRPALLAMLWAYVILWLVLGLFPLDFVLNWEEFAWKQASGLNAWTISPDFGSGLAGRTLLLLGEVLATVPLGLLWGMRRRRPQPWQALLVGLALGALMEGLQSLLASGVGQGISIASRALGFSLGSMAAGLDLAALSQRLRHHPGSGAGAVLLLGSMLAAAATTWSGGSALLGWTDALAKFQRMEWLPFYHHYYTTEAIAMRSLVLNAALYLPIGGFWAIARLQRIVIGRAVGWLAPALIGAATALLVEVPKLFLSGLHPDATHLLLGPVVASGAAGLTARLLRSLLGEADPVRAWPTRLPRAGLVRRLSFLAAPLLPGLAMAAMLATAQTPSAGAASDPRRLASLPHPADVAAADFAVVTLARPRLPAPTPEEAARLFRDNPAWWQSQRDAAADGQLDAMVLMAFLEPGAHPLTPLLDRLVTMRPDGRGHEQAMPLAQAYDWLFEQWSDGDRARLREVLVAACEHTAEVIRSQRLSPYNVFLYNAPLQALSACAIALNRDDARGTALFNFAWHLWDKRVLPVWRQVMGHNGGWHEGGEYVGIGIGQAVYRLPALWGRVTGIDYFAEEPGLRGFLDFLLWRVRPDGTHIRIGDGAHFDRAVPDLLPLAVTYGSSEGARAAGCERLDGPVPTSWPWGPLYEPTLCSLASAASTSGARHFDGIGLVISRTGGSADSTYVTFKAGDNFWSHMHLDQGSFTIFRGGDLAIDSGVYGSEYGSEHHMNYAYQTIAHNAVTVTDPTDTAPGPGDRPYANDGGQRRVGSGWGVLPAPLDRTEWEAQRDSYRTGEMLLFHDEDNLTVTVADLTRAYTNRWSGTGTFSARTRRVQQYTRTFIHDRLDDVIIVRDDLALAQPGLTTRWLLHSEERPVVGDDRFLLRNTGTSFSPLVGGSLSGRVFEPRVAKLALVGGDSQEFEVAGVNWDEGGRIQQLLAERPELVGGRWRLEVTDAVDTQTPRFLVVLLPGGTNASPSHRLSRIAEGSRYGCEVAGPRRTTRWWFEDGQAAPVKVEIIQAGELSPRQVELGQPSDRHGRGR